MRLRMGDLRQIMSEAREGRADTFRFLLNEDGEGDSQSHVDGASGDSLDNQVDRYLAQYEGEAKKSDGGTTGEAPMGGNPGTTAAQMEHIEWRDLVRGVLIEAGQADKDAEQPEVPGQEPDKLGVDSLDVAKFADQVVRLIENYDSLLEVRNTLMRRARGFLEKTYDDDVLEGFDNVMRDDHGMEPGKDSAELSAEKYPAPSADRASGSAQAGPGGGPPGG